MMAGVSLSDCVACLHLIREQKGKKEAQNWQDGSLSRGNPWTCLEVELSKVKITKIAST